MPAPYAMWHVAFSSNSVFRNVRRAADARVAVDEHGFAEHRRAVVRAQLLTHHVRADVALASTARPPSKRTSRSRTAAGECERLRRADGSLGAPLVRACEDFLGRHVCHVPASGDRLLERRDPLRAGDQADREVGAGAAEPEAVEAAIVQDLCALDQLLDVAAPRVDGSGSSSRTADPPRPRAARRPAPRRRSAPNPRSGKPRSTSSGAAGSELRRNPRRAGASGSCRPCAVQVGQQLRLRVATIWISAPCSPAIYPIFSSTHGGVPVERVLRGVLDSDGGRADPNSRRPRSVRRACKRSARSHARAAHLGQGGEPQAWPSPSVRTTSTARRA